MKIEICYMYKVCATPGVKGHHIAKSAIFETLSEFGSLARLPIG